MDKIILDIKSMSGLAYEHMAQTMNYLKVLGSRLGLLVNFGQPSLKYKRIVI
jgi:GxxExxY protein